MPKQRGTKQVICGDGVRRDGSLQAWGFAAVASDAVSKRASAFCLLLHYSNSESVFPARLTVCPPPLTCFLLPVQSLCQTTCNHLVGVISA